MKKITDANSLKKFPNILLIVIIILLSFFLAFFWSQEEIKDAKTLSSKAAKALESTKSYRFDMTSNLSLLNEDIRIMWVDGEIDSIKKKVHISINSPERSIEAIIIGDKTYLREKNNSWQVRKSGDLDIWKDKLSEQRLILANANNLTMYRENSEWILEIVPEKEEIMEQMRSAGLETAGTELKSYVIRYWIEPRTFYINKVETRADVEMNFRGMQTQINLNNVIHLGNYNEKTNIEAPI